MTETEIDNMWNDLAQRGHSLIATLKKQGIDWRGMQKHAILGIKEQGKEVEKQNTKQELLNSIATLVEELYPNNGSRPYRYYKGLDQLSTDDLKIRITELSEEKELKETIANINSDDWSIEQYLIDDYDMILDKQYLKHESQIEAYFVDDYHNYFDCGQGYYEECAEVYIAIGEIYYRVELSAEIYSSKQDRGDRLYWVEKLECVKHYEIEKPKPILIKPYEYNIKMTIKQKEKLDEYIADLLK
jgi:hypothetical protein